MSHCNSDSYKASFIKTFLSHNGFRQYNVEVSKRLGHIEYAILLNDLIDQYAYLEENNALISHIKYGDGLMYYTIQQAYKRCGIHKDSFDSAIKLFIKLGFIIDSVKFGMPPTRHFRLDFQAIHEWLFSNNVSKLRKPAIHNAETRNIYCGNPQPDESKNESKKESKRDRMSENKSSFCKDDKIVFFDPFTYKLRDGSTLSPIMARTLAKKLKEPKFRVQCRLNVQWYESEIDKGTPVKTTHEKMLQFAISNNMASKENQLCNNRMYAQIMKEEHKLQGLIILKTVVKLEKKDGSVPESIKLNLPETTFSEILDRYIENYKDK